MLIFIYNTCSYFFNTRNGRLEKNTLNVFCKRITI
jgi:hypothetical protein